MSLFFFRPRRPPSPCPSPKGRGNFPRRFALIAALLTLAALTFDRSLSRGLFSPRPSTLLLDRHGHPLGEIPGSREALGYWPLPEILPERIVAATLETEDRHFYEHPGVHLPSIARAVFQNVRSAGIISGASTLAMQVARLQSPAPRSLPRKLKEAAEALLLVRDAGHDRLLRQYLTLAPYGNRVHGATRASRLYFDKPLEDLSWLQAAFLAGLPQRPGRMNPYTEPGLARAKARARRILRTLHARGFITQEELARAIDGDLGLVPKPRRNPAALHALLEWSRAASGRHGTLVRTTLDLEAQEQVAAILTRHLSSLREAGAGNAAAMAVDTATGDILVYAGSDDFFSAEGRGAINYLKTKRSPGSALKPFFYGLALEQGRHTAASELADTPVDFETEAGRSYLPENVNHTFLGPMLFRDALGNSRNIPALRVLSDVGIDPALTLLEKGGVAGVSFEPGRYGLGLAIGNLAVTLEELVGLYGVLARRGETLPLRRFLDEAERAPRRLLGSDAAQLLTHLLADPRARRPSFPAGSPLDFPYAVAVKTGTSQGNRDAWAVGISDRLLVGVWLGNHDWRRMNRVAGLSAAAALHEILDALMPTRSPHRPVAAAFPVPSHFVSRTVCPLSGRLLGPSCPQQREEIFIPGTEPYERCPYHSMVAIERRNGLRASEECPASFVERRAMLDLPAAYADWAKRSHVEVAPQQLSPHCTGGEAERSPALTIREPRHRSRYLWDPDTPRELSAVRLSASVTPSTEEIVWIVDGVPVARVGYPHEVRWSFAPGAHTVRAAMARRELASAAVTVVVEN